MPSPNSMNLLYNLNNAGTLPFYMSADEGSELASNGLISVESGFVNPINPSQFLVRITDAGKAILTTSPPAASVSAAPGVKQTFTIDDNIPLPAIVRGGGNTGNFRHRTSQYPFEQLQVNQSFHVAVTAEDAEPHKKMASNVSAANKRSEVPVVPGEVVRTNHKRKLLDPQGKPVKGSDGKDVYEQYEMIGPKMVPTKKFVARQVNATDPKGAGVRVFRVL